MFSVHLKNKEDVQVPLEQLEEFLERNRERIQVQYKKIGRRTAPVSSSFITRCLI